MQPLSDRLATLLIDTKVIESDDRDLYAFGIHQACLFILNVAITMLIGAFLGMLLESVIFLASYIPIRIYAGGYHSKTQLRCYLFSIVIIVAALLAIKLVPWSGFICTIIMLCAGAIILALAPVEDKNKPLSEKEKSVYRKCSYAILCILVLAALIAFFVGLTSVSISIAVSLVTISVMLVLGKLKNFTRRKH